MLIVNNPTFFSQIIKKIENLAIINKEKYIIVLPNKRSKIDFLTKISIIDNVSVFTIDDFIQYITGLRIGDNLGFVNLLYEISNNFIGNKESFERFYEWGMILLKDFNEIDSNLIDPNKIFINIKDHKELNEKIEFLSAEQKKIVKEFWNHFIDKNSKTKDEFLLIWNSILKIYKEFNKKISQHKEVYRGFILKRINELIINKNLIFNSSKIIFAGFSALSRAENNLFLYLNENYEAEILWDINKYYIDKKKHPINSLFKKYKNKLFQLPNPNGYFNSHTSNDRIKIFEASSDNHQSEILSDLILKLDKKILKNSAIVVNDEKLMKIIINTFKRKGINYKSENELLIKYSEIYILINKIIKLQILLNDNYTIENELIKKLILEIFKHRYFKENKIKIEELSKKNNNLLSLLLEFLKKIKLNINNLSNLEIEYIDIIEKNILKLKSILKQKIIATKEFSNLFNNLIINTRIRKNIENDGIKIIGIEETRCLDFEYLFILSMNETKFPIIKNNNSLIPANLRKAYGLPTIDKFYNEYFSYLFFRLLHRSKSLNIIYKTNDISLGTIEPSRYILQLMNDKNIRYQLKKANNYINFNLENSIIIKKNKAVFDEIINSNIIKYSISPTSINTYLDCELKFYLKYIKKIKSDFRETDNIIFGKVLHKSLKILYNNTKIIAKENIEIIESKINEVVNIVLNDEKINNNIPKSIFEKLINNVINQILIIDKNYTPFKILGSEIIKTKSLKIDNNFSINLKGIIDRIDKKNNIIRIIDYKTGNYNLNIKSIKSLFDKKDKNRNSIALQLLAYSFILKDQFKEFKILPIIIGIREIFKFNNNYQFRIKENRNYSLIYDITPYFEEFEYEINNLLKEILNPKIPFLQTNNFKICQNCEYKNFCKK